ncbi:zinc finger C2H2-type/integrase DNA-binding domain-containing protein [Tanacetum coccineum]|uniref:Zinc finger C2H2-type/integrase DNA-binding domain-containing protein n=1 Tax=Tanacetum coccineum TaxID=301880 RepID=A0ABQ5EER3_9ASTR
MDKVTENCEKEDSLMMIGSSTSMLIKLKIPKPNNTAVKEGKRVCSVCKKEFSSSKALGGHMRVHVMYHKNGDVVNKPFKSGSKLFKRIGDKNQDLSDEGLKVMINKPYLSSVNDEAQGSNSNVVENGVDLTKYLKGWSVTERRGRRSLKMDDSDEDDEDLLEAVEDLMSLANGHRSSVIQGSNSNANSPPSIDKRKAVMQVQMELDDHEPDSRNSDEKQLVVTYKCNKQLNKKRQKMKLMNELELESGSDEYKFRCTTCNKCFSSHQALGGHRSSHNKAANKIISDDHFVGENVEKEAEFAGDVINISKSAVGHVHQCKICDKVFPTGQALGGHKRCHWTGYSEAAQAHVQAQAQAISSQITSTGEAASTQTESGRIVLDFDLNEVPAIMMEDEGGDANANVNGNGYASSSYNSNMGY